MQLRQQRTLESARRVQQFMDEHCTVAKASLPYTLRDRFDAAVEELAAHQLEQELAAALARCETANYRALRRDLYYGLIRPIGLIASIALRSAPEYRRLMILASSYRARHFLRNVTTLTAAAEAYAALFVQHGMPDDLIDQLHAALAQLAQSAEARERHRRRQIEATHGLCEASRAVRRLVDLIDSVLAPKIKRDQTLVATWIASRRSTAT
jgi:hypothetical protein